MPRRPTRMHFRVSVVVEKDEHGYFAFCPQLQGCFSQGGTYEEAMRNIEDAIRLHIEDRRQRGEPIPTFESVAVTSVDVLA